MYRSVFTLPGDLFAEFDRIQQEMQRLFGGSAQPSSIRAVGRGVFPALNIGNTPQSVEIYAFAPGIDPAKLDVSVDRGLLIIAGERASDLPTQNDKASVYASERFAGSFRRVVSLPDDVDPSRVEARYRDGVVHISLRRRESALPKRIEIQ